MTVTFCAFLGKQNIQYALLDMTSPIFGISFVLIVLRLNLDKFGSVSTNTHATSQHGAQGVYPLQSISVKVSRHTEVDSEVEGKTSAKGPYGDMA